MGYYKTDKELLEELECQIVDSEFTLQKCDNETEYTETIYRLLNDVSEIVRQAIEAMEDLGDEDEEE